MSDVARFVRFAGVGIVAFGVDAGVLLLGLWVGLGWVGGRVVSFLAAVTASWLLNRMLTFRPLEAPTLSEWATFSGSQLAGAATNWSVYAAVVGVFGMGGWIPVVGGAAGSLSGLAVNFFAARRIVYADASRVEA